MAFPPDAAERMEAVSRATVYLKLDRRDIKGFILSDELDILMFHEIKIIRSMQGAELDFLGKVYVFFSFL